MHKAITFTNFKFSLIITLLFYNVTIIKAQDIGYGCIIGNTIYKKYLGNASPYHPSNPPTKFYDSTGPNVGINYNHYSNNKPNNYNYICGLVNVFSGSAGGPDQQEFVSQNSSCVISTSLGGNVEASGTYVSYNYNKPRFCYSTPPMPIPLDDYIFPIMICISGLSFYFISRKNIQIS